MAVISVVLEWQFTPPDYFEQSITVSRSDYTLVVDQGKAEATIDPAVYDANPSLRDTLHGALNARFLAVQLLSHAPYQRRQFTVDLAVRDLPLGSFVAFAGHDHVSLTLQDERVDASLVTAL